MNHYKTAIRKVMIARIEPSLGVARQGESVENGCRAQNF
jgi:hypothetical protein